MRHHVRGKKNTVLNMVNAYATLERVGTCGLSNTLPNSEQVAEITVKDEDDNLLKDELTIMVTRILSTYMDVFQTTETTWSIQHRFSEESTHKSEIVCLCYFS